MSSENRTSVPNSLNEHWMPFTSNKDFKANPRLITEAKGVYLKTHHGKTQIDASSGLFCNPLGHGRKEITEAVTKQLETLDYAQPFQQGFGGSFELATKISKHTPGDLNKMFFTICGSTAVETAIKIAVAYHRAKGVYLKTHHGKTQIDASSGLFCNPLGHGRKEITEAVTKQLETLDYAQPFQQGFGGSFELATKISKHTPGDLNKMFFTICG